MQFTVQELKSSCVEVDVSIGANKKKEEIVDLLLGLGYTPQVEAPSLEQKLHDLWFMSSYRLPNFEVTSFVWLRQELVFTVLHLYR